MAVAVRLPPFWFGQGGDQTRKAEDHPDGGAWGPRCRVAEVSDELREAYQRHHEAECFQTTIAERDIVVTPSEPLEHEVLEILSQLH